MMGVEHIAAQVEMPFGTYVHTGYQADDSDPCDLNLDLFCVELRCECESIIERLPEGDEEDLEDMSKSDGHRILDDLQDDDGGDY
jgi:putative membrane protein